MRNKNKGIDFELYLQLVVAELAIAGYSGEDNYPAEDEVKEDWEKDLSSSECAESFIKNWIANTNITLGVDDLLNNLNTEGSEENNE